jgi:hypothetical protein
MVPSKGGTAAHDSIFLIDSRVSIPHNKNALGYPLPTSFPRSITAITQIEGIKRHLLPLVFDHCDFTPNDDNTHRLASEKVCDFC